jgi:hypothetical protein
MGYRDKSRKLRQMQNKEKVLEALRPSLPDVDRELRRVLEGPPDMTALDALLKEKERVMCARERDVECNATLRLLSATRALTDALLVNEDLPLLLELVNQFNAAGQEVRKFAQLAGAERVLGAEVSPERHARRRFKKWFKALVPALMTALAAERKRPTVCGVSLDSFAASGSRFAIMLMGTENGQRLLLTVQKRKGGEEAEMAYFQKLLPLMDILGLQAPHLTSLVRVCQLSEYELKAALAVSPVFTAILGKYITESKLGLWEEFAAERKTTAPDLETFVRGMNTATATRMREAWRKAEEPKDFQIIISTFFTGSHLHDLLVKRATPDLEFDRSVCIQVAQTLTVLERFQIRHNDLHDSNVKVKALPEPEPLPYAVGGHPYITRWRVGVYDLDRMTIGPGAWGPEIPANPLCGPELAPCRKFGDCQPFLQNYDWAVFLAFFDKVAKDSPFIKSIPGFQRKAHPLARPCVKARGPCEIDTAYLEGLITPSDFLLWVNKPY